MSELNNGARGTQIGFMCIGNKLRNDLRQRLSFAARFLGTDTQPVNASILEGHGASGSVIRFSKHL
jgi:hypothetical protein